MGNNHLENDNFLEMISNFENEINRFQNVVSKISSDNKLQSDNVNLASLPHGLDFRENAACQSPKVQPFNQQLVEPQTDNGTIASQIRDLANVLSSLKSEFFAIKQSIDKHDEAINSLNRYFANNNFQLTGQNQNNELLKYIEKKFNQLEQNQKNVTTSGSPHQDKIIPSNLDWPVVSANNQRSTGLEFIQQWPKSEASRDESSIKNLGDRYSRFIDNLRNECVIRIKNAIAIESERFSRTGNSSLKNLSAVIFNVIETEKKRFQEILHNLNNRILSALDENFTITKDENGVYLYDGNVDAVDSNTYREALLEQVNDIQEQIDDNLVQQYQFYHTKKKP